MTICIQTLEQLGLNEFQTNFILKAHKLKWFLKKWPFILLNV